MFGIWTLAVVILWVEVSFFSDLIESFRSKISYYNCSNVNAMQKYDIKIKSKNDFGKIIPNVLYVPALKTNMLSVGQSNGKHILLVLEIFLVRFVVLLEELCHYPKISLMSWWRLTPVAKKTNNKYAYNDPISRFEH